MWSTVPTLALCCSTCCSSAHLSKTFKIIIIMRKIIGVIIKYSSFLRSQKCPHTKYSLIQHLRLSKIATCRYLMREFYIFSLLAKLSFTLCIFILIKVHVKQTVLSKYSIKTLMAYIWPPFLKRNKSDFFK